MIDWGKALEVFVVGFGGVFLTLIILQAGVFIFSKAINQIASRVGKKD